MAAECWAYCRLFCCPQAGGGEWQQQAIGQKHEARAFDRGDRPCQRVNSEVQRGDDQDQFAFARSAGRSSEFHTINPRPSRNNPRRPMRRSMRSGYCVVEALRGHGTGVMQGVVRIDGRVGVPEHVWNDPTHSVLSAGGRGRIPRSARADCYGRDCAGEAGCAGYGASSALWVGQRPDDQRYRYDRALGSGSALPRLQELLRHSHFHGRWS